MPRASAIIATYNWSTVLPYSIGSALDQTERDLEVLVVGDGCTDDSAEIVRAIADTDDRVKWFNLPERSGHQSGPNNFGLERARADVVFYLGHDDLWFPRHVELLLHEIERGADVANGWVCRVDEQGRLQLLPGPGSGEGRTKGPPVGLAHRRSLYGTVGGWTDYRTADVAPEFDLINRFRQSGALQQSVSRITAVKLPAAVRPDVYRERPCHEQEYWLGRIRSEPDLEAKLMGQILQDVGTRLSSRPIEQEVLALLRRLSLGAKKRIRRRPSVRERVDRNKKRKGSDP